MTDNPEEGRGQLTRTYKKETDWGSVGVNGYRCDTCGGITYIVHADRGVTPMFLACRFMGQEPEENPCKGRGTSLMYPDQDAIPEHVIEAVDWEWYRPTPDVLDGLTEGELDHVLRGGCLLRLLTDAGREALTCDS